MEKLINVTHNTFWEFVKINNLKEVQGAMFHSSNFINESGEVMAYRETSSWNPDIIYQIKGEENLETVDLVKQIINGK